VIPLRRPLAGLLLVALGLAGCGLAGCGLAGSGRGSPAAAAGGKPAPAAAGGKAAPAAAGGKPTAAAAIPAPLPLRIETCCDSFAAGDGSSDHNGYRKVLGDWLTGTAGLHPEWVGNLRFGDYPDPYNEGHGGYTIPMAAAEVGRWLADPPPDHAAVNVVLLYVGTNDAVRQGRTGAQMLADYAQLLDAILRFYPTIRVVAATLMLSNVGAGRPDIAEASFNAGLPALVAARGPRVTLADMSIITDEYDGIHPNNLGYQGLAYQWYRALGRWYGTGGRLPAVPCPFPSGPC
jgi:lysophospholipase L1-like esterase